MSDLFPKIVSIFSRDIFSFILHPEFEGNFLYIKNGLIFISSVLIMAIIFLLIKSSWVKRLAGEDMVEVSTYRPFGIKQTIKDWAKINKKLEGGKESEYKLGIIEADILLDDTLKKMGYSGESVGDRLKQIDKIILPNLDDLWKAHKVRNNIVHDPDYKLTVREAKEALKIFEEAFQVLNVF